jgi:hypothetical protein
MIEIEDPNDRPLTFIDVDDNPLRVWLRPDRVQLHVIDCRPGLEAGELRRFASLLFATYVGPELAAPLAAARASLVAASAAAEGSAALVAAVAAIDAVTQVLGEAAPGEPELDPAPRRAPVSYVLPGGRRNRAARGHRAGEPRVAR